ncbi:MAG: ABC transporter ATP-binding protein [Planctomycetes bacterium]|nr:ABC transporter ATP-binding protein [Planctomycetota bacterium]
MNNSDEHAVVVESLIKDYGSLRAVNDVSFTVARGGVFAFLGPNGAGKTTTVEIIETIRRPTSGRVRVLGMDVSRHKNEILARIGVLPQGFCSFDRITVGESIRYYSRLFRRGAADVDSLLDITELRNTRDVLFKDLSGGLKQRLGIAIALVNDPEVVFLDEPTTGLDPHARRGVWDVLRGLKRRGRTVFLTTHYMEEAELLADTVAIISKGRIVASGSPDELIDRHAPFLCLTLRRVGEGTIAVIRRMGFEPVGDARGGVSLRVKHADNVQEILRAIGTAGKPLPGLEVRRPTLEEVYLELTDGKMPDGVCVPGGAA